MEGPLLDFDTSGYERHKVSSFIYEPVRDEDGKPKDFRILYASELFQRDWGELYHRGECLGSLMREDMHTDERLLRKLERFCAEPPFAFVTYLPMVNLHLFFEPIPDLPEPYAGFYMTNITSHASQDAKDHFLQNIRQMRNNAVLMQRFEDGHMEPVFVSEEFAEMMECPMDEAIDMMNGEHFFETTVPEDRPLVYRLMKYQTASNGGKVLTIRKTTAKGNVIWCSVHYSFIDDFNSHYLYVTYADVTALKEHEDRLRSTYSSMGDNFYRRDESTLALFRVNLTHNCFEEVQGREISEKDSVEYTYTEAVQKRAQQLPIVSERKEFLKLFDKDRMSTMYQEGKAKLSIVVYMLREHGHPCFVNYSASLTLHPFTGDLIAFVTVQECNAGKVGDTLIGKILAHQFDMVAYLVDGEYGVTIGEAEKVRHGSIFPKEKSGFYQKYLDEQVYPVLYGTPEQKEESREALKLAVVEEQLKREEPYVVNIAIELEGEVYYKRFDFYNIDPEACFYILLKSDTTEIQMEQMALNAQLHTALEEANQANIAKTAFLSSMSHEIRTPMNAIIGLDSIALNEPGLSLHTREQLEKIGASARHLLGLINDILDMTRIESGRMSLKHEEFSFSGMLEQINTMIHSQCQDRGLNYECRIIGHVNDYYIGDDMKLKQVIINILGNSVKFTPAPGTVSFIVEQTASYEGQSTIRFIMKDTGIGMDASYLPKVFDAFSQENSSNTNKYGSTGLGMAITKNIVDMMNGEISVESEKGVGTQFTVNVTLRNSERRDQGSGMIKPSEMKVLVIDDDPIACEHARIVLEEQGISVDTCLSGEEAIEKIEVLNARRESYNLILVDWKMPEKDGVEATREIRRIIGEDSAVIILTAYNWDEVEQEAIEAGVDSFLAKPLFASSALSAYEQTMRTRQIHQEEQPKADLKGRRILLAEDIIINAEIMMEILGMEEMEVEHAENGRIAVDIFTSNPPHHFDAVLMDMRMPVMDGLAAAKAIRESGTEDAATIPIIALTANAFDEDVQRSLQAGMNAHLSKPVEPDRLFETLASLIR